MTTKREFDEDDLVKTRTLNFRQSSDAWFGIDVIYGIRQLPDEACHAMNHRGANRRAFSAGSSVLCHFRARMQEVAPPRAVDAIADVLRPGFYR